MLSSFYQALLLVKTYVEAMRCNPSWAPNDTSPNSAHKPEDIYPSNGQHGLPEGLTADCNKPVISWTLSKNPLSVLQMRSQQTEHQAPSTERDADSEMTSPGAHTSGF